jgi:hypothetical protein
MKLDFWSWLDNHPILRWILFHGIAFGGLYLVGVAGAYFVAWAHQVFPGLSSGEASCSFILILISILYIIFRFSSVDDYNDNKHY